MSSNSEDGTILASLIELHQRFIVRGYGLIRFIRQRLEQESLRWVTAPLARNGYGASLASPNEWVQSYLGIAFVDVNAHSSADGKALVASDGLRALMVQLRWLDRSTEQPVVWLVDAHVTCTVDEEPPFEPYLANLFSKLTKTEPHPTLEALTFSPRKGLPLLSFTGTYHEIALSSLLDEKEVNELLISKALSIWRDV